MSRIKKIGDFDRVELRVFIIRHYDHEKEFCAVNGINYTTFRTLMAGHNGMRKLMQKVENIIIDHDYPIELVKNPEEYRFTDLRSKTLGQDENTDN